MGDPTYILVANCTKWRVAADSVSLAKWVITFVKWSFLGGRLNTRYPQSRAVVVVLIIVPLSP